MEVEVKIRGLLIDPVTNQPIIVMQNLGGNATLPIWIAPAEAQAIALELQKEVPPRPQTHDLIRNLLIGLDVSLVKVVVTELKDSSFYSVLWLQRNGQLISMDSRTSDAVAIALRMDCPIFVEEKVFKACLSQDEDSSAETKRWLEGLGDEDLGPYKM
jgi:uncharacterized protein